MINVKIRYMGKELSTEIPKRSHELNGRLVENGRNIGKEQIYDSVTLVQGYDAEGKILNIDVSIETVANYVINSISDYSDTDTLPESEFEAVVENSPNVSSEIENSSSIETPTGEAISANGRTPIESEKKTEEMLDNENKDYTHKTILDENLHTLSRREAGSIAPDHMAAYWYYITP